MFAATIIKMEKKLSNFILMDSVISFGNCKNLRIQMTLIEFAHLPNHNLN